MRFTNGIPSHDQLSGLTDDDHPQYHPVGMRFNSGRYFNGTATEGTLGTFTTTAKELIAWPFRIPIGTTFDRFAINVTVPQAGSTTYVAIYLSNTTESAPNILIGAVPITTTAAGIQEVVFGSVFLGTSMIWIALVSDTSGINLSGIATADAHLGNEDIATFTNAAQVRDADNITPPTLPAIFGASMGINFPKPPSVWPLYLKTV